MDTQVYDLQTRADDNAGCEDTMNLTAHEQTEMQAELTRIRGILDRMRKASDAALAAWERDGCTMPELWRKPLDKAMTELARARKDAA